MKSDDKLILKYEGGQTDRHVIDAIRFGESLKGVGKLYSSVAHLLFTGELLQPRAQPVVRVEASESGSGCYEIGVLLSTVGAHSDLFLSQNMDVYKWLISKMVGFIHDDATGRGDAKKVADEIMKASKENPEVNQILAQGAIDNQKALIDILARVALDNRGPLKSLVAPVGPDCKSLQQFEGGLITTEADADAIRSKKELTVGDIQDYVCEQITGLDVSTGLCKLKIKDIEGIVNGKISDPVLELPHNVYSTALDMHTKIIITAKPHLQLDQIKKLYISNALPHYQE
ncbi:hypothetical protein EBI01_15285 [Marinomonas rhizomae]|uniref:Uncharacterized protein n=1 Tax=Marinomonas rhizomae TaxID=491948 RepID=A0A366IY23_9GAMM|nr:hypothetical protein [Marinomonas rhizomae]RBP79582.1 hypothetical protein DFP80_11338 [Marinomonas rhizomae]RNF71583.1 hypothetical protein EBI01_15285 [Marinomonas rhizomae]